MAAVAICDLAVNLFHKKSYFCLNTWVDLTGQVNINTGVEVREGTTDWYALTFQPQEHMHSCIKEATGKVESQRPD